MPGKYCVVPMCTNSSVKTPEKLFFRVPTGNIRKQWWKVMKRADTIKNNTCVYCCEDHFDVENDMDNYIRYKLMGGLKKLKKNVLPHKFACQKQQQPVKERTVVQKRHKIETINRLLHNDFSISNNNIEEIFIDEFVPYESVNEDPLQSLDIMYNIPQPLITQTSTKKIQVSIKNKMISKSTMTNRNKKQRKVNSKAGIDEPSLLSLKSDSILSSKSVNYFKTNLNACDSEDEDVTFNIQMQKTALLCISREPQLLLGLPKQCYFIIDLLSEHCKRSHRDIMVTLKKVRLYQANSLLALDFGLSKKTIGLIFKKTLPIVALCMKRLIFFPDCDQVLANLPVAFRKRYSNIQCIIDCLEIQIEKPTNAVQQSLTWSEYKGANTIKYLVSITPDGLINYISEGYGGRTSDSLIFEDCEILKKIPKHAAILADRGFKNIGHLVFQNECKLIRPPSVFCNITPTKEQVIETKKIAALRIHVERTISRIRQFGYLMPHACVDYKQISLLDYVMETACGIINLQNPLFGLGYD